MTADSTPRIVFRADASLEIGTGHVMRCLALADALRERGAECDFVCEALPGDRTDEIRRRGFGVWPLNGDWPYFKNRANPHFLIVDHYGLDRRWEEARRPDVDRIMVIDDLADRAHDCDLLLDQNLGRAPGDYAELVPPDCTLLCGPEFALLRPEFAELRAESLARRAGGGLERILVTMGGVDKDNATGRVLEVLADADLPEGIAVTVVMGRRAPWLAQVQAQAAAAPFPVELAIDVHDMAQRMAASDFAIGAAGSTSWERCCMGLPSALVVLADNQAHICRALADAGAAFALGTPEEIDRTLAPCMDKLTGEPAVMRQMSAAAARICDGRGAEKVADALLAERSPTQQERD